VATRDTRLLPFSLAVGAFVLTYWCVDITSPALTEIQEDLVLSDTVAGLIFSVFFAGRLVANFPAAFLADRVGARTTAGMGAVVLLAASVLASSAPNEFVLLPARALQGTGVSLLVLAALLSTLRARPSDGAAMTIFNVASGVGGACGLVSGGLLADNAGWRSIYWMCAGLAAVLAAAAVVSRTRPTGAHVQEHPSSAGQAAGMANIPTPTSRRLLAAAIGANLLVYGNYSIFVVGLPLFADEKFGASSERIGTLLLVTNLTHLAAALPSGRFVRRWGSARVLTVTFGIVAAGMILVILSPSLVWVAPGMAIYAIGAVASNIAAGDQLLRLGGQGGKAVGLMRLSSDVGLVLGPAAAGALADLAGAEAPFVVLAILTVLVAGVVARVGGQGRAT
jgi:MFS family permease